LTLRFCPFQRRLFVSGAVNPKAPPALILPTIFYHSQQDGRTKELVDAFIRSTRQFVAAVAVELTIDGTAYHQTVQGNQDFGEQTPF
jgi:hypothetical protein